MTAELAGKAVAMQWTVTPPPSSEDHAYLPRLVELARADKGMGLPTVGSAGLRELQAALVAQSRGLGELGQRALATGDVSAAALLADAAQQDNPANPQAAIIRRAADKVRQQVTQKVTTVQLPAAPGAARPSADASAAPEVPPPPFENDTGRFLSQMEQRRRAQEGALKAEVRDALAQARGQMVSSPTEVTSGLKMLLEDVRRAADINEDVRAQLSGQIVSTLRKAQQREVAIDMQQRTALENLASRANSNASSMR